MPISPPCSRPGSPTSKSARKKRTDGGYSERLKAQIHQGQHGDVVYEENRKWGEKQSLCSITILEDKVTKDLNIEIFDFYNHRMYKMHLSFETWSDVQIWGSIVSLEPKQKLDWLSRKFVATGETPQGKAGQLAIDGYIDRTGREMEYAKSRKTVMTGLKGLFMTTKGDAERAETSDSRNFDQVQKAEDQDRELDQICNRYGLKRPFLALVHQKFIETDSSGDGYVSEEEFKSLVNWLHTAAAPVGSEGVTDSKLHRMWGEFCWGRCEKGHGDILVHLEEFIAWTLHTYPEFRDMSTRQLRNFMDAVAAL